METEKELDGFVEENLSHRELGSPEEYVIFATDDLRLYVYNLNEGQFQKTLRAADEVLHSYKSFDELIIEPLKISIGET